MKQSRGHIAVIGAGSWGTALAKLLSDKGERVALWAHRQEQAAAIARDRENRLYLPGYSLNQELTSSADFCKTVTDCKAVVMVVPSHVFRTVFLSLQPFLPPEALILSATKGIENETLLTMTQVIRELSTMAVLVKEAVLSGPSFAKEVALGLPTAVTVASSDASTAIYFQELFATERFRVYTSADTMGLELGGALKNIIAVAAGICDGLGFGTNTRAALITRGLAEIIRLGVAMGANPLTFAGLGGLGDLVLTCTGELSRNRTVGLWLGKGKGLSEILTEMHMVAEGVKTTKSAYFLAKRHTVEMPITEQVYQVLYENRSPLDAVKELLSRDVKKELESPLPGSIRQS